MTDPSLGALSPFYFDHDGCFLVPIEHLTRDGVAPAFAAELESRGLCDRPSIEVLGGAVRVLYATLEALWRAAPDAHLPPRLVNILVVTSPETARPYFQPFPDTSALLYAADLDPATSSAEHAAFQLLMAERLGQLRRFGKALLASIPFLLALSPEEAARFQAGAEKSNRPDGDVSRALAAALPALRRSMWAEGLGELPSGFARAQGTTLGMDRAFAPELGRVGKAAEDAAARVASAYLERQRARTGDHEAEVAAWLERERPGVLVLGEDGAVVWDPERPSDTEPLRAALQGIGELPAKSLIADLATIDRVSRAFLDMLADPGALVVPTESLEEAGGVFVHHERRLIAYGIAQPGLDVRVEAAPPFHRLLLAARVAHEWGHLAVDGGAVPVPLANRGAFGEAEAELRELFLRVVRTAPAAAKDAIDAEIAELERERARVETLPLARIEDYRSNVLFRRVLSAPEREAYIRVNIRSLLTEPIGLIRKLARYAYEAQYLWLSEMPDPWHYLFSCTYLREELVDSDLVSEPALREIVALVGRLCRAYEVDVTKLKA